MKPLLIYCCDPSNVQLPDDMYQGEATAAQRHGFSFALVSYEALVHDNNPAKAVRRVPVQTAPCLGIYRGWMLKPSKYELLCDALAEKGIRLINDLHAYRHCHYLPESYSVIERQTPRSVWMETAGDVSIDRLVELLRPFGSSPVIVKDFVKSQKHEWEAACFIPSASDRECVERVVKRFLELQKDDLNEGLVFREFIELEPLTRHSKSGMPLTKEFRLFYLNGQMSFWTPYWEEGNYEALTPPFDQFQEIAAGVKSRFFTMDVAKKKDSTWVIVELGDGQVAGLPENADVDGFYQALAKRLVSD